FFVLFPVAAQAPAPEDRARGDFPPLRFPRKAGAQKIVPAASERSARSEAHAGLVDEPPREAPGVGLALDPEEQIECAHRDCEPAAAGRCERAGPNVPPHPRPPPLTPPQSFPPTPPA